MYCGKGFTLVELLVVVLILGAISAVAVPRIIAGVHTAKVNVCKTNVDIINTQYELYYEETGQLPNLIAWLAEEQAKYFPDGLPRCPFGQAYIINPATRRVREHQH